MILFSRPTFYYAIHVPNDRYIQNERMEEHKVLLWIAMLALGVMFLSRTPRLAEASDVRSQKEVRAYIDGKPVDSYVKENEDV